jgi:acid phosphatase family membrane protein YuiD
MDFFANRVFWVSMLAWALAQVLKVPFHLLRHRHLDVNRLVGAGGMPSSHSAFVSSLTTAVGVSRGWDSAELAISLVFSLIIMYDAAGVRQAVGKQAKILNAIIADFQQGGRFIDETKKFKELMGHTPFEVFAGALLGALIVVLVF